MTCRAVKVKDIDCAGLGSRVLWLVGEGDEAHHVTTSYAEARTGPETFVFRAGPDGSLAAREDLPGSLREPDAHEQAIAGYVDSLNGADVPLPEFTTGELFERAFGGGS